MPSLEMASHRRGEQERASAVRLARGAALSCVIIAGVVMLSGDGRAYGRVWGVGGMGGEVGRVQFDSRGGGGGGLLLAEAATATADPLQTSKMPSKSAGGKGQDALKRLLAKATKAVDSARSGSKGGQNDVDANKVFTVAGQHHAPGADQQAKEKTSEDAVEGKGVKIVDGKGGGGVGVNHAVKQEQRAAAGQVLADDPDAPKAGDVTAKKHEVEVAATSGKHVIGPELSKELTHLISKIVTKVAANKEKETEVDAASSGSKAEEKTHEAHDKAKTHMLKTGAAGGADSAVPDIADMREGVENGVEAATNASKVSVVADLGDGVALNKVAYKRLPLTYFAWLTSCACVMLTIIIASHLILKHLEYYQHPETQKYVVRILFMAPIYAVDALLGLTFVGWMTTYIDVFRDCYEAFTIYNFLKLLVVMLGGEKSVTDMLSRKPQISMIFPLNYFGSPWEMGAEMFYNCKYGVLQYVIVKPCCALITFVSGAAGIYGPNSFSLARLHFYVFLASNTSQMWAIYCLVTFYFATREELAPFNPVLKFVIVKAVVFFCFWQGMVLGLAAYLGYFPETADFTTHNIVEAVQEVLVCIEMVLVSVLFHKAFPVEEFADVAEIAKERAEAQRGLRAKIQEIRANAADPFRVNDIRDDISIYGEDQKEKLIGAISGAHASVTGGYQSSRESVVSAQRDSGYHSNRESTRSESAFSNQKDDADSPLDGRIRWTSVERGSGGGSVGSGSGGSKGSSVEGGGKDKDRGEEW